MSSPSLDTSQGMSTRKEQVDFSTVYNIKLSEKRVYDERADAWFFEREAKVDVDSGDTMDVNVNMFRDYNTILKNIAIKVKALQYLNDGETLKALRKDILVDIVVLLYKLERGDTK